MTVRPESGLRVGVINLMPKPEAYQPLLRAVLGDTELTFIRLRDHAYASSDRAWIEREYVLFEDANARAGGPLDGLILTGAPVEELSFEEVRYWPELSAILREARATISSTLGLCWGGMALAQLMGIGKVRFRQKLFGSYPLIALCKSPLMPPGEPLWYAQSRHAGVHVGALESAVRADELRVLAYSELFGYTVFESSDSRYLMHLGHPEYTPQRLVEEYLRDRALQRRDVGAPYGVDLEQPERAYRSHGASFFAHWLERLADARDAPEPQPSAAESRPAAQA